MTITIGHDSGPPKRIKLPRQRWNLGADFVFTDENGGHRFLVVARPDSWDLHLMQVCLRSKRAIRRCNQDLKKLKRQSQALDFQIGPKHLFDVGWLRRNWGQL